jgi:ELWxxDGT repeat protein
MQAWRRAVLVCGLVAGCGGSVEEAPGPASAETGAILPTNAMAEVDGEAARECHPEVGEARRVKTLLPPSEFPSRLAEAPESLVEFRGQLYFAVNFEDGRQSLWRSDGTEPGTVAVREFPAMPNFARVTALTPAEDRLFFLASEAATGQELWVSDGTPGGTRLVEDLAPGVMGSSLSRLTGLGRTLVFFREPFAGAPPPENVELWRSDGSAPGTERLRDLGAGTSVSFNTLKLGSTLVFFTSSPGGGTELWRTDGTAAGTVRVLRLDGDETAIFDARVSGTTGYFTLIDTDNSTEVWKTDGTAAGTVRLRTFGPALSTRLLGAVGGFAYITLTDVTEQRMHLYRLRTDGSGVREYVTTLPNPYATLPDAFPYLDAVSAAEGRFYFSIGISTAGPAPRDTQLWVTDGTRAGTRLLRRPLSLSDEYGSPVYAVSGRLAFFSAYEMEGAGIEPWLTDGTTEGTRRLHDVAPGGESSYPRSFTRVGDRVFFSAFDDTRAGQLWSVPVTNACLAGDGG